MCMSMAQPFFGSPAGFISFSFISFPPFFIFFFCLILLEYLGCHVAIVGVDDVRVKIENLSSPMPELMVMFLEKSTILDHKSIEMLINLNCILSIRVLLNLRSKFKLITLNIHDFGHFIRASFFLSNY